eukprot:gene28521-34645_t
MSIWRSRLRTKIGSLVIGAVTPVEPETWTAEEARRAGFEDITALERDLRKGDGALY